MFSKVFSKVQQFKRGTFWSGYFFQIDTQSNMLIMLLNMLMLNMLIIFAFLNKIKIPEPNKTPSIK